MKKIVSMVLVLCVVMSFISVYADGMEGKTYTFDSVKSTAVFSSEGTHKNLKGVDILLFDAPVKMTISGDALNGMLCEINVTLLNDTDFECMLPENMALASKIFNEGNFPETEIPEGAYLLFLDSAAGGYSTLIIIVGEPEIYSIKSALGENVKVSPWAEGELLQAHMGKIITDELKANGDFVRNITRGEFAHIIALVLSNYADYNKYADIIGEDYTFKFNDTKGDLKIEFVSYFGIINGIAEGVFDPDGELTREQAATMLARMLTVLSPDFKVNTVDIFADDALISDWAKESVYKIAGVKDTLAGYAVMGGVGAGLFSPRTGYTVEQALISVKRLFYTVS